MLVGSCGKHGHFQVPNLDPSPRTAASQASGNKAQLEELRRELGERPAAESLSWGMNQPDQPVLVATWSNRGVSGPKNLQMRVKPSQGSQFCVDLTVLTCAILEMVEVAATANGAGEPQAQCPNSLFQYQVFM